MKTILFITLSLFMIESTAQDSERLFVKRFDAKQKEITKVANQIKTNKPDIDMKYAKALAESIHKHSKDHKIDPGLVAAILAVESMYDHKAYNKRSKDYGIAQINIKTVSRYKLDKKKLLSDIDYTIESGIKVLSYFHKRYSHKEKNWFVRYNVGTAKNATKSKAARQYHKLVTDYLPATK